MGVLVPYEKGLAAGEFLVPRCSGCHRATWPPRELCPRCGQEFVWETAPADASLFTWTVVHRTPLPEFRDLVPYAVGVLAIEDLAIRVVGRLAADPASLEVDSRWTWRIETGPMGDRVPVWHPLAGQEIS